MKDIFSRFTNDSIASTAFGVKINSLENKLNKFYVMGKKATNFSGIQYFKFFAYSSFPYIMKVFCSEKYMVLKRADKKIVFFYCSY